MRKPIRTLLLLSFAAGLAVAAGAAEEPRADAPKTELERFHAVLREISAHITNAGAKLNHGAVSMGQDADGSATPAQICCGNNIETIRKRLATVAEGIRTLRACYREAQNVEAEVALNLVYQDAGSLYRALENFRSAKGRDVRLGYGAVVKGQLLLEQSAKKLTECPAPVR